MKKLLVFAEILLVVMLASNGMCSGGSGQQADGKVLLSQNQQGEEYQKVNEGPAQYQNLWKGQGSVNINNASEKELILVPGIDRDLARNIVRYRNSSGPFNSVDELIRVQGVDKEKLDNIRGYLKVQGITDLNTERTHPPQTGPFQKYSNPK